MLLANSKLQVEADAVLMHQHEKQGFIVVANKKSE
jgi:hypothetical protein